MDIKTSVVLLPLLIITAVPEGRAVTPTFLQSTTVDGTAMSVVYIISANETTGIKSEPTTIPISTPTTPIPSTTTKNTIIDIGTLDPDICNMVVPNGYEEFYTLVVISGQVTCVSHCHPSSPRFYYCNEGTCELQHSIGPHCLCPQAHLYLYSGNHCDGKISKLALYIGVGVAVAVLLIIIIILGICLYRVKRQKAPREKSFYECVD